MLVSLAAVTLAAGALSGSGCLGRRAGAPGEPEHGVATITGRLVSLAGRSLASAEVILEPGDGAETAGAPRTAGADAAPATGSVPMATERLSAHGLFRIGNVPPGRYVLRGRAAGHAEARVRLEARAGERLATVLRVAEAETLDGKVVDKKGLPIPSARVVIASLANPTDRPRETFTDAAGGFVAEGLDRGMHRLIVEAPGFGSLQQGPIDIPSKTLLLQMDADGKSITGTVTSGGRPAGGARVLVGGENLNPGREVTSNGDGTFVVPGLGPGVYVLRASRGDEVSSTSPEVVVDPSSQRPQAVHLEMLPGYSISGRVVDDTGRPSPGSEVRIDALPGDDPLPEIVRAGNDGAFRSGPLRIGEYRLTPRRPGFVARHPVRLLVGPRAPSSAGPQVLELVRGAAIFGRVADARNAPLRDAVVRCLMPGREDLAVLGDRLPLAAEAAALPSGSGHALGPSRSTSTDRDGRFQLGDMLPGRFFVEISHEGSVAQRSGPFSLAPGQRLDAGRIVLAEGVRVTGRVMDGSGAPIEGARVIARPKGATVEGARALTDGGGQFSVAVSPGENVLEVSASGMTSETLTVRAPAGAPPAPVSVRLTPAQSRFDGAVSDSAGRPLARAQVVAWPAPASSPADGVLPAVPDGATALARATTDAGGNFELQRLPRGPLLLEIKHADYPASVQIVAAKDDVTPGVPVAIQLAVPGAIEGDVRESVSGAIISAYRVEARGPAGRVAAAARKGGAGFVLSRLYPGRWQVSVHAPGYATAEKAVDVAPASMPGDVSVRGLRLELQPEAHN